MFDFEFGQDESVSFVLNGALIQSTYEQFKSKCTLRLPSIIVAQTVLLFSW